MESEQRSWSEDWCGQTVCRIITPCGGTTNNPSASRFTTAFHGAVLDKNTRLMWEQAPDPTPRVLQGFGEPNGATNYCINKKVPAVGGTRGWRLPPHDGRVRDLCHA